MASTASLLWGKDENCHGGGGFAAAKQYSYCMIITDAKSNKWRGSGLLLRYQQQFFLTRHFMLKWWKHIFLWTYRNSPELFFSQLISSGDKCWLAIAAPIPQMFVHFCKCSMDTLPICAPQFLGEGGVKGSVPLWERTLPPFHRQTLDVSQQLHWSHRLDRAAPSGCEELQLIINNKWETINTGSLSPLNGMRPLNPPFSSRTRRLLLATARGRSSPLRETR